MDHLAGSRFPALAGWRKSYEEIFAVLNEISYRIFSQFQLNGQEARPIVENGQESWFGKNNRANPVRTLTALALRLSRHFGS